jgi:hypothetical protein
LHYQTQDNPLAFALQNQIEWTSFGTTLNPFKRYLSIRPIVQWYNSWRMNHYIEAEIEERFAEHMHDRTSQADQKRSKLIISLVLDRYLEEEQVKDRSPPKKLFKDITSPQLRLFLFAGRDTTSSTLLYCYHLLATHPKVLFRLLTEHDQVFGTDIFQVHEMILQDPQRLNQILYTSAVIKEVLRLFPPSAPMRQGRPGADIVDEEGRCYPTEGCNVWTLTLAPHHNPNYWKVLELQLSWLHLMVTHTGSFLWVLFSGALLGLLIRAIYSELLYSSFLSIYMGPVVRQVDHQVIQSILCCASITTYICDFNRRSPSHLFLTDGSLVLKIHYTLLKVLGELSSLDQEAALGRPWLYLSFVSLWLWR